MASIEATSRPSLVEAIGLALRDRSLAGLTGALATAWRLTMLPRTLPWALRAQALAVVMVLVVAVAGGGVLAAATAYDTVAPAIRSLTEVRGDANQPPPPAAGSGTVPFPGDEAVDRLDDRPAGIASAHPAQPDEAAETERPRASERPDDGQRDHEDADAPDPKGNDGDGQSNGVPGGSGDSGDETPSPTSHDSDSDPSPDTDGSPGGDDGGG